MVKCWAQHHSKGWSFINGEMKCRNMKVPRNIREKCHSWRAKYKKAWNSVESYNRIPPLPLLLNTCHFIDLIFSEKAYRVPVLLKNFIILTPNHLDKVINFRLLTYPSFGNVSSIVLIQTSISNMCCDRCFEELLGQ